MDHYDSIRAVFGITVALVGGALAQHDRRAVVRAVGIVVAVVNACLSVWRPPFGVASGLIVAVYGGAPLAIISALELEPSPYWWIAGLGGAAIGGIAYFVAAITFDKGGKLFILPYLLVHLWLVPATGYCTAGEECLLGFWVAALIPLAMIEGFLGAAALRIAVARKRRAI